MATNPLLAEIIPRRTSTYVLILAAGIAIVAVLDGLYVVGLKLASLTTDGQLAAFDLDSEGSIASWFSIVLLFLCGQAALLVRRLRVAAGCRRREAWMWLATACVWFVMSLDEAASLHEAFKELAARLIGTRVAGDGSIYWVVPYAVVLSGVGAFILASVKRTPAAAACLISAAACYALAVASQTELIWRGLWPFQIWFEESCEMLGDLLILLTFGLYARCLVLPVNSTTQQLNDSTIQPPIPHLVRTRPRDYHPAQWLGLRSRENS
jgi:hypothetical protein